MSVCWVIDNGRLTTAEHFAESDNERSSDNCRQHQNTIDEFRQVRVSIRVRVRVGVKVRVHSHYVCNLEDLSIGLVANSANFTPFLENTFNQSIKNELILVVQNRRLFLGQFTQLIVYSWK